MSVLLHLSKEKPHGWTRYRCLGFIYLYTGPIRAVGKGWGLGYRVIERRILEIDQRRSFLSLPRPT